MKLIFPGVLLMITVLTFGNPGQAQSNVELEFLDLINRYRNASSECWTGTRMAPWPARSSPTLARSPRLSEAAYRHNNAMIEQNCTQHTCPGEPHLVERVTAAGYTRWNFLSENIAGGFGTAAEVFEVWRQSTGHNRNMLSCRASAIGISMVYDPDSLAWWYWTTDFGDFVDGPAPTQTPLPTDTVVIFERLDANDNHIIGDKEITQAIALWVTGDPVPGTNAVLSDNAMTQLMALWVTGEKI